LFTNINYKFSLTRYGLQSFEINAFYFIFIYLYTMLAGELQRAVSMETQGEAVRHSEGATERPTPRQQDHLEPQSVPFYQTLH
jgi:hypothetical protein